MSLVDTTTGEVIEFDRAAAERRAERINLRLEAIASNYAAVMPMIREAIAKRDDLALGYRSPGEYVSDRFGHALSGLGIEVRRQVVRELTDAGMSTRAIAPVVGVHHDTVATDLRAPVGNPTPDPTPDPHPVTGAPAPEPRSVTGIDGKTYTRPTPKPAAPRTPPRRALTDQFFEAAYDMGKAIEKVARLTEDDRFPQNAEKVAAKHRNDLLRARDLLQQVIDRLA